MTRACFDFHDVPIDVESDDEDVLAAVAGRLRHFERPPNGRRPLLHFTYRSRAQHDLERPTGPSQPAYDPPAGEVAYFPGEDLFWIDFADRVRVHCDPASGRVDVSFAENGTWLLSRPMFTLPLVELLKRHGLYNVHAASVAVDGRAVLFAGPSGSGKSTLALALAREGFGLLGDDMCFLRTSNGSVDVLPFPDEIDVADEPLAWFEELHALAAVERTGDWPKHRVRAEDLDHATVLDACEPAAVVFVSISGDDRSTLQPIGADEALQELAPNVLLTDPASAQNHLDALGRLVRHSACYRLAAARDFGRVASLVRDLLR